MKSLSDYTKEAQTKLLKDLGAFFAFSNKQFEEQQSEEVEKYVRVGDFGMICPKNNVEAPIEGLENTHKAGVALDIKENGFYQKCIDNDWF